MYDKSHVGMSLCFFCGEPKEVLLDRRLRNTLPRQSVYNLEPCDECKPKLAQGITFIEATVENGKPTPTGKFAVITEDAFERIVNDGTLKDAIRAKRVAFIDPDTWKALGISNVTPTQEFERANTV